MPRVARPKHTDITASDIFEQVDNTVLTASVKAVLRQGGAVMLGQTRDNSKLIVTVYLDGDQDKEYCESVKDVIDFLGQYQV